MAYFSISESTRWCSIGLRTKWQASDYQQRLFEANIPITMFGVENVQQTYDALTQKVFTLPLNRLQWVVLKWPFSTILAVI